MKVKCGEWMVVNARLQKVVFSPRDRFQWHAWLKISNFEHYSLATWSKLWDLAILRFWNYFPIIRPTITAWKCPYSGLFWSVFSRIRTENGEIRIVSPYSVQMRKNMDQNNSKYGHFSRGVSLHIFLHLYNTTVQCHLLCR